MDKLAITAALFALGLWVWSEYFRAIPHLEQPGVLKNFKVEVIEPHEAEYRVLDKQYYSPNQRMLHPASPMVGSFNDLAYLSNIDVLLVQPNVSTVELKQVKLEQDARCFSLEPKESTANLNQLQAQIQNLSVIAANESVANQIRRLKSNQHIKLSGDWVNVHSVKINKAFHVGFGSKNSAQCRLFRVNAITRLN
ncbi:hypothetical protein GFH30_11530 [Acinetobacter wanghuae]|uniref:LPS export ABC transporter periplasmic protein LptC n=1 Tax=Acinetobacter wanghuae TaxID=2662362 RepID=A0A5Q0P4A9_9GAMM|nr:hypothetical protein [Acinetobacter wanghuae]MQW92404.1 hypothetical protein [Acinetobacter wanghuae]QGA11959.1 hypothetical protein GFH30_11530 [Acinetobacter wanghuae]